MGSIGTGMTTTLRLTGSEDEVSGGNDTVNQGQHIVIQGEWLVEKVLGLGV